MWKRVIALLVVVVLVMGITTSSVAASYSQQLGTAEALGSPLLDAAFNTDNWNKWELIAFGVFLSNFVNPLVDSYETAFQTGVGGSNGSGFQALSFGGGADNQTLTSMLDFVIQNAVTSVQPLYVTYTDVGSGYSVELADKLNANGVELVESTYTPENVFADEEGNDWNTGTDGEEDGFDTGGGAGGGTSTGAVGDRVQATVADILDWSGNGPEFDLTAGSYSSGSGASSSPRVQFSSMNVPTFYIATQMNTNGKVMFSYLDPWDTNMMAAWIGRCTNPNNEWESLFRQQYSALMGGGGGGSNSNSNSEGDDTAAAGESAKLFVDTFGNIVAMQDGKLYMVFPSCSNQHITVNNKQNLLTSLVAGSQYMTLDTYNWLLRVEANNQGMGIFNKKRMLGADASLFSRWWGDASGQKDVRINGYADGVSPIGLQSTSAQTYGVAVYHDTASYATNAPELSYGERLYDIMGADIRRSNATNAGLVVEFCGMDLVSMPGEMANLAAYNEVMSQYARNIQGKEVLHEISLIESNTKVSVLGDPITFPVNIKANMSAAAKVKANDTGYATKRFVNYLANSIKTGTVANAAQTFATFVSPHIFYTWATQGTDGRISEVYAKFIKSSTPQWPMTKRSATKKLENVSLGDIDKAGYEKQSGGLDTTDGLSRVITVYPKNATMQMLNNYLSVKDGTEFSRMAKDLYYSYLLFYGVLGGADGGTIAFDTRLYDQNADLLNMDVTSIIGSTASASLADKKQAIIDRTYLMLDPENGRDLRKQIQMNNFTDTIYDWYNKIVYGESVESYTSGTRTTATRVSSGFLTIDNFFENPFTAWFMKNYAKCCVVIIGIGAIVIFIFGILGKHRITWFITSLIMLVNTALLAPSLGDVLPYISNAMVEKMFSNSMEFWAISETIENTAIEDAAKVSADSTSESSVNGMNVVDYQLLRRLLNTYNNIYVDRSLMLKWDISRKVTSSGINGLAELQSMQSASWLIPAAIRQYSAPDKEQYDYVYIPMGDALDSARNIYWLYVPMEQTGLATGNAKTDLANTSASTGNVGGWVDTRVDANDDGRNTTGLSKAKQNPDNVHSKFYILPGVTLPAYTAQDYTAQEYEEYIVSSTQGVDSTMRTACANLERIAGQYDMFSLDTVLPEYGYLWTTESPLTYFYATVRDSFDPGRTYAAMVDQILGYYTATDENSQEIRINLMTDAETGGTVDILDLEELFTNVIPYMYNMQCLAGGTDGRSGVFGLEKIEDYDLYKSNNKSWLFRSNWVTKIKEMGSLVEPETLITVDDMGNTIGETVILNPIDPKSYPAERPMVFSRAQQMRRGMEDTELTQAELRMIEINERVAEKWTLLLNYVNIDGMNKEVMYKQMALTALMEFNKAMTTGNVFNSAYALQPLNVSLRNISLDSLMRLLMLGATHDTAFAYGDTMYNMIADFDIVSCVLLLISTAVAVWFVPLARNITMAALLFLGLGIMFANIVSPGQKKVNLALAYTGNMVLYMLLNLALYGALSVMIVATSPQELIATAQGAVHVQSPIWVLIILLLLCGGYLYASVWVLVYICHNYKDLGASAYALMAGTALGALGNGIGSLNTKLGEYLQGIGGEGGSTTVHVDSTAPSADNSGAVAGDDTVDLNTGFASETDIDEDSDMSVEDIDNEVQKGKSND